MNRFYLVENPMADINKPLDLFILQTVKPNCLIKCIFVDDAPAGDYPNSIRFDYENSDGVNEEWILQIAKNYDNATVDDLYHTLQRAKRWYIAYMQWEDGNIDEKEFSNLN